MTWIGYDGWIVCGGCGGKGWVEVGSGDILSHNKVPTVCPLCHGRGGHEKPTGLEQG